MANFTAVTQIWKKGKLVTDSYAIPMASESACYRCAGAFRTSPVAFTVLCRNGVEFLRVPGSQFWANKAAIQKAYPNVWRESGKARRAA